MKIACLTGNLKGPYQDLALYTIHLNKAEYCKRHGYHLEIVGSVRPKFQDQRSHASGFSWSRFEHMADMVESGRWDWVWCVGADTLVTNMKRKLELLIAESETPRAETMPLPVCPPFPNSPAPAPVLTWTPPPNHKRHGRKHLLICGERVTSMQADSFLVRGSKEGSAYLRDILAQYEAYKHHVWVENQTMIDLRDKWAAITYMVPQWKLNCVDYRRWYHINPAYRSGKDCYGNRGQWKLGDFLIHWPAGTMDERLFWLDEYWPQIVR